MAEKVLLIQPRWMMGAMAQQQIEFWREKFPRAQLTLLAATPLEQAEKGNLTNQLTHRALPPLQKRPVMRFLHQLRRTRFRYVVVLSDNARGDVGYGEAKFWAFVANARRREFEGKPLTLMREAKAKRKVALVWAAVRAARLATRPYDFMHAPLRPETMVPPQLMNSARTFVYLQHARHEHGLEAGCVFLYGASWDAEAAQRCGWKPSEGRLAKEPVDLFLTDSHSIGKSNPPLSPSIKPGGLNCYSNLETKTIYPESAVQEVENRPAFFDETARDIWLRMEP
ncbi:MAG TPA: hypothetical protein VGB77_09400 [Abditibacteriaceae bacterium]